MKKIKAIIFDADGMVIKDTIMFSLRYQEKYGISNDEMLPFFKGKFQDCLIGKSDLKEELKSYLKKWKWNKSVDELLKFWFEGENKIDQKIASLIEKLKNKNIKCYLMTNNEKYRAEYIKNEMNFDKIFDYVFSSADIGFKKPEKECFDYLCKEINKEIKIKKDEILFCDDDPEYIDSIKKFGFEAYLYKSYNKFVKILKAKYQIKL